MKGDFAVILIDFSKAFDLIDHEILNIKLKNIGFDKGARKLLRSYLTNRQAYVEVNGLKSKLKCLDNIGCPQGSCLGPLLY